MDKIAKAVVGALLAGLGSVGVALSDGHVTATEWVVTAVAVVTALAGVWAVPNAPTADLPEGSA
jgi:hypothetical protein